MLSSLGWTVEIMLLCIMANHMSPITNLEELSQSSGQLLYIVLQVVVNPYSTKWYNSTVNLPNF